MSQPDMPMWFFVHFRLLSTFSRRVGLSLYPFFFCIFLFAHDILGHYQHHWPAPPLLFAPSDCPYPFLIRFCFSSFFPSVRFTGRVEALLLFFAMFCSGVGGIYAPPRLSPTRGLQPALRLVLQRPTDMAPHASRRRSPVMGLIPSTGLVFPAPVMSNPEIRAGAGCHRVQADVGDLAYGCVIRCTGPRPPPPTRRPDTRP